MSSNGESLRVKVIEINYAFFQREKHALNDLLKREFNAVEGYAKGQESSFLCLAEKDSVAFNFIIAKDDEVANKIVDCLTPRQIKRAGIHKARFLQTYTNWKPGEIQADIPSSLTAQDLLNKKLIKIRIFDEPFYLFETFDPSKLVF